MGTRMQGGKGNGDRKGNGSGTGTGTEPPPPASLPLDTRAAVSTCSTMRRVPPPVDARALENAARAYLQTRFTSRAWLRRVLMRRVQKSLAAHGGDREALEAALDGILDRLVEARALDDAAYTRGKVRTLTRRGVAGPAMAAKLAQKGINGEDLRTALAEVAEEEGADPKWAAACAYVRRRRMGPYRGEARAETRDKDLAAMGRAGFSYALAARALDIETIEEVEAGLLA